MHYTYEVLPHEGVSHLEYEGKLYELDKLTEFEKSFLFDKTSFIKRTPVPVEPEQVPVPVTSKRKASAKQQ